VLFSALVTPVADVTSMFIVAFPMAVLFGAAVAITALHDRRTTRHALASDLSLQKSGAT
jgi:sec-independent protein translocase protein TatC